MTSLHPYHQQMISLSLEPLLAPGHDLERWRKELARCAQLLEVKERIWARTPERLTLQSRLYLERIEEQLELTLPVLQTMMSYRGEAERQAYTRLVRYRGALLDERDRVERLLSGELEVVTSRRRAPRAPAANDDLERGRLKAAPGDPTHPASARRQRLGGGQDHLARGAHDVRHK